MMMNQIEENPSYRAGSGRFGRAFLFLVVILTVYPAWSTSAEVVQFRMTGEITVDFVLGDLPEGIYDGAPFEVRLSYDTTTPEDPLFADDPHRGLYPTDVGPNNFLHFRAGPAKVHANDLFLWVGNDAPELPTSLEEWGASGRPIWDLPDDSFQMWTSTISANFTIPLYNQIGFRWRNARRSAFDSEALPTQLNPDDFSDRWFWITTGSLDPAVDQFTVRAIVKDIVRIPEPDTWQLALLAVLVLAIPLLQNRGVA